MYKLQRSTNLPPPTNKPRKNQVKLKFKLGIFYISLFFKWHGPFSKFIKLLFCLNGQTGMFLWIYHQTIRFNSLRYFCLTILIFLTFWTPMCHWDTFLKVGNAIQEMVHMNDIIKTISQSLIITYMFINMFRAIYK